MVDPDGYERTRLLNLNSTPKRRWYPNDSPLTLHTPLAVASCSASSLPTMTIIQIVEVIMCQLWYQVNESEKNPEGGASKLDRLRSGLPQ